MALILIPVDPASDEGLRLALDEFGLLVGSDLVQRGTEPLMLVPLDDAGWDEPRGTARILQPGEAFEERLTRAFQAALVHVSHAARLADRDGRSGADPVLIIAPILCGCEPEDVQNLDAVWEALEPLLGGAASTALGAGMLESVLYELTPWAFVASGVDVLPPQLFGRPGGRHQARPIVHTGQTGAGEPRRWHPEGSTRLLADLLLLYALSASREAHDFVFRPASSGEAEVLLTYSALFEYPLEELVTEQVLEALIGDADRAGLVPKLSVIRDHSNDAFAGHAGSAITTFEDKLQRTDPALETKFAWSTLPQERLPESWLTDFALRRRADGWHTGFYDHVERQAGAPLDDAREGALGDAYEELAETGTSLDDLLMRSLEYQPRSPDVPLSGTARSLAAGFACADTLIKQGRKVAGQSDQPAEPIEAILSAAASLRPSWLGREADTAKEAAALPAPAAVRLETLSVGLCAFFSVWLVAAIFLGVGDSDGVVALIVGTLGGLLAAWFARQRRLRKVVTRSAQLAEQLVEPCNNEAKGLTKRLGATIPPRVRRAKRAWLDDKVRGLEHVRRRLETEVVGFRTVAADRLADRRAARAARELSASRSGRFRVDVPKAPILLDDKLFHASFREFLQPVLTAGSGLSHQPVSAHLAIIDAEVQRVAIKREDAVGKTHEAAVTQIASAVRDGTQASNLSRDDRIGGEEPHSFGIVGRKVASRLAGRMPEHEVIHTRLLDSLDALSCLPDEIALFGTVRVIQAPKPPKPSKPAGDP